MFVAAGRRGQQDGGGFQVQEANTEKEQHLSSGVSIEWLKSKQISKEQTMGSCRIWLWDVAQCGKCVK